MQRSVAKKFLLNYFWLSLLCHLLLILLFSFVIIVMPSKQKKLKNDYIPAYTASYRPAALQQAAVNDTQPQTKQPKSLSHTQHWQQKPLPSKKIALSKHKTHSESILASSLRILQANQLRHIVSTKKTEPIYLMGDTNGITDPLVKLLAQALSAHFEYPKEAGEFGIKGRVLVGLTLHPEGFISDIHMLKSSSNNDLDAAALRAVNTAPTVIGADRFLSKPKYFVVGFVFK